MSLSLNEYSLVLDSPVGRLGLRYEDKAVCRLDYLPDSVSFSPPVSAFGKRLVSELEKYFRNPAFVFSLPVELTGTPFQQRVWAALQAIPAGKVRTYGQLAAQLGSGPRAVGNACRRNPVSIIVPCHRVVSATGMGGYSGMTGDRAIWRKHCLLTHEGANCAGLKNRQLPPSIKATSKKQRTIHA